MRYHVCVKCTVRFMDIGLGVYSMKLPFYRRQVNTFLQYVPLLYFEKISIIMILFNYYFYFYPALWCFRASVAQYFRHTSNLLKLTQSSQ